jgi:hypothetical protein
MRSRAAALEINAPVPSALADLSMSPIVEVMIMLLAIVHDGLQKVESSYGPRSTVYARRTGGGIAGRPEIAVLRKPSGRSTRLRSSFATGQSA